MLNTIIIQGRLTKDPEIRKTSTDKTVSSFTVACERPFKDNVGNKVTDFIPVVAWHATAKFVYQYFKKGDMILVQGRLQSRNYTDNNGDERKAYEILAENINFAGGATPNGKSEAPAQAAEDPDDMPFDI